MTSEGSGPSFRVALSPLAKERIRAMNRKAEFLGIGEAFFKSLSAIDQALQTDPRNWGDPYWRLSGLKMVVYSRIFDRLMVGYGVHEVQRHVWLRTIMPVLGHPLLGSSGNQL